MIYRLLRWEERYTFKLIATYPAIVALLLVGVLCGEETNSAKPNDPLALDPSLFPSKLRISTTIPVLMEAGCERYDFVWQSWTADQVPPGSRRFVYNDDRWIRIARNAFGPRGRYADPAPVFLDVEYPDKTAPQGRAVLKRIAYVLHHVVPNREIGYFRMFPPRTHMATNPNRPPASAQRMLEDIEAVVRAGIEEGVTDHIDYVSPWMFPLPRDDWFRANVREAMRLAAMYGKPIRPSYAMTPHPVMVKRFDENELMAGNWLKPEVVLRQMRIMEEEGVDHIIIVGNAGNETPLPDELIELVLQVHERLQTPSQTEPSTASRSGDGR